MKLKFYTTHLIIILPILVIVIIGLIIFLPSRVEASDPVKAEMYMGDYEIRKNKVGSSFVYEEVKYIETGSAKVIKKRTSTNNTWVSSYYHTNHQGSTSVVTANNGRVDTEYGRGRLRYFPYGEQITSHNINTQAVADTYTGQKRDTESNLMFYNARLYNQKTGLFMQADSVNDGLNRYSFVGGDPINKIDPSGKTAGGIWDKIKSSLGNNSDWNYLEAANQSLKNDRDYVLSSQYTKDQAMIGGALFAGVSAVYVAPAVAPVALSYFVQAQQALGSPKAAIANFVSQVSDSVSGLFCTLGSQFGCAVNSITGPLSTVGDVTGSMAVGDSRFSLRSKKEQNQASDIPAHAGQITRELTNLAHNLGIHVDFITKVVDPRLRADAAGGVSGNGKEIIIRGNMFGRAGILAHEIGHVVGANEMFGYNQGGYKQYSDYYASLGYSSEAAYRLGYAHAEWHADSFALGYLDSKGAPYEQVLFAANSTARWYDELQQLYRYYGYPARR